MAPHTCDLSTLEAEAREVGEFKLILSSLASLCYVRPCLKAQLNNEAQKGQTGAETGRISILQASNSKAPGACRPTAAAPPHLSEA